MQPECRVQVEEKEISRVKGCRCSKTALVLLCTLTLVGCAATVLIINPQFQATKQEDGHLEELRLSLRQTSVRAAIHLVGVYNAVSKTLQWNAGVDQAHSEGGLRLEKNEIVVPHDGLYFVYSQASYRISCRKGPEEPPHPVQLSHSVERWSDSYGSGDETEQEYRPILHTLRTACVRGTQDQDQDQDQVQGAHSFSGLYVGAMFNLKANDRLRTVLSPDPLLRGQVEDGHGETFFGVFAL
ncbi:unnamed protein product [Knipowitschia caucasica]|uniref:THD domain-containing protein n=1 Tax=Knipowitschia caucasica TaxID=637954 RepID=A0AAV2K2G7_KNICA